MTAVLPLSRLAHTRLFSGRGGAGASSGRRAGDAEQAFHDLLWGTHPRRTGEDGRDRGHALLVGLLPFRQPRCWLRAGRLDHGNALAIDGGHQDGAGGGLRRTLPVKSVKVLRRIRQDLLQAAFGDGNAGQVGYGLDRIEERILHGGLDQAPLEFVGERAGGQSQRPIQGKDAGRAGAGVAHADEFDGSKDGGERAGAQPAMRVEQLAVCLFELQGGSHISVAAMLQMGLEEQALDLAAFVLLLGLDLVEGELEGAGGCQPGLKQSELNKRRAWYRQGKQVAVVMFLRYYYRKNNATLPVSKAVRPAERNAPWSATRSASWNSNGTSIRLEYFCKGTVLKRMMKCGKAAVRLRLRP